MEDYMDSKINIEDIEWKESTQEGFSSFRKQLAMNAGGEKLGVSLYKLLPGNKAFPFHCHHANEEAIFVLSGEGTLRLNDQTISIKANDYVAFPCGTGHAHQVINTSNESLIYLCISTMIEPDVMEYPDSDKIGLMLGSPPGGEKNQKSHKGFYRKTSAVPYFDGEH